MVFRPCLIYRQGHHDLMFKAMTRKKLSLEHFYQGRTLNFAHRGARRTAPENTLPAFELALTLGAHGVELDVWPSLDGIPVVIHDAKVNRTTDGTGIVNRMCLAELQELDAGIRFSNEFRGTRLPTLEEVFASFGDRLLLNIELKPTGAGPSLRSFVNKIAGLITKFGLKKQVLIASFNPVALRYMRHLMPEIALGFLYMPGFPLRQVSELLARPIVGYHEAIHPHLSIVNYNYVQRARHNRYRVNVWTVNEIADMQRLVDLGVDMLITDVPDMAREVLNNGS